VAWSAFLADLDRAVRALDELAGREQAGAAEAHGAAEALFAARVSAALTGQPELADALGRGERAVAAAIGPAFAAARAGLAEAARRLGRAAADLAGGDASGARITHPELLAGVAPGAAAEPADAPAAGAPAAAPPAGEDLWVPQVDDDMIEPFLEEVTERVEGLAQKLLALESAPGDAELVREVFRDLHTVKGSAGFVGLLRMNRLAHAAEDLVGQVRDGGRRVDRALIDALLAALDGLRGLLAAAARAAKEEGRAAGVRIDVDIAPYLARLRAPGAVATDEEPADAPAGAPRAAAPSEAQRTLRVDFDKLDQLLNLVGELVLARARLHADVASLGALTRDFEAQLRRGRPDRAGVALGEDLDRIQRIYGQLASDLGDAATQLDHVTGELRQQVMKLRMLPIGRVFTKYHRTVRELANRLGKRVQLVVEGAETELDKVLLEQLDEPLMHLCRNAIDHGIEQPEARRAAGKPEEGTVTLFAHHRGNQIVVEVRDDGAGIDPARLREKAREKGLASAEELAALDEKGVLDLIFRPGFSTAARVTDLSGRGVGMDVVRENIARLSGSIELTSTLGGGTTFRIHLPLTLAIIQVLLVRVAGEEVALPLDLVQRTLALLPEEVHAVHEGEVLYLDDEQIPLITLGAVLEPDAPAPPPEETVWVVLVRTGGERYGLIVDRLVGKREIVLKTFGELLTHVPCASGATLVGDRVVLVLDPSQVVQRGVGQRRDARPRPAIAGAAGAATPRRPRVLIVEDSDLVREGLRRALESHGCEVLSARDGAEALELAERDTRGFDLVSTDVMMPRLDGYELTRALRAHPRHKDVPIVMVTSRSEHLDRVRGFDAGVDEYLVKPLESAELIRALERRRRHARSDS
jgi:two-component system chemotaxis sensor kinase CheA